MRQAAVVFDSAEIDFIGTEEKVLIMAMIICDL